MMAVDLVFVCLRDGTVVHDILALHRECFRRQQHSSGWEAVSVFRSTECIGVWHFGRLMGYGTGHHERR